MSDASHEYDARFYQWVEMTAETAAKQILPVVKDIFAPSSVLDVGCGSGTWLKIWNDLGVKEVLGVDGDYVLKSPIRVPREQFVPADLTRPFSRGRAFDLVQSLEVAEHISQEFSSSFVETLSAHGDVILFSAAQPGQGGESHVNEQPPEYWRRLFRQQGYRMFDALRHRFLAHKEIAPWYRYNMFIFLRGEALHKFGQKLSDYDVTDVARIHDPAPLSWRLRCAVLSTLPVPAITSLSKMRYRIITRTNATRA